ALGTAEGCAVDSALVLAGGDFGGGAGGGSSTARSISSVTSREAFLNSLIPFPSPLANSGIRLAPNKTRITTSTRTSSPPLNPNTARVAFIKSPIVQETKPRNTASKARKPACQRRAQDKFLLAPRSAA